MKNTQIYVYDFAFFSLQQTSQKSEVDMDTSKLFFEHSISSNIAISHFKDEQTKIIFFLKTLLPHGL